jgi:hypothetical protein
MGSRSIESILAVVARTHAAAVGVTSSQQWFAQRQDASCTIITVQVLRYMQAGLLPTEVALLLHREFPCDLSSVRLNCTLPALMMQQQKQQQEHVVEFGLVCGYAMEMLVCLALLHARESKQFAAACLHQAYFTFGSALRSATSLSSSSSFCVIYSRLKGLGGILQEGQGVGVFCADDIVGLYTMDLQVQQSL